MDNHLLWSSFLSGNKDSFQQIYTSHYQSLFNYGMRRINQADVVRDCIHDLFVNLWTKRSGLSQTNNIKLYLMASLRNQIFQIGLKGANIQQVELGQAESFELDFDPESILITRESLNERAKKLILALDKLTARQKEVLYLHFFEELSHEEIAELLNLSVKGVYKLKYRGLEALRELMGVSKSELMLLFLMLQVDFYPLQDIFSGVVKKI